MPPDTQQAVLAKQLQMNPQTWAALQQHGVTPETDVRLDFFYVAPDQQSAESLATLLRDETDYEVRVGSGGGGFLKKKTWAVSGTTQDTKVSREILDQWVTWMVTAGFTSRCEFDGWGAQAP